MVRQLRCIPKRILSRRKSDYRCPLTLGGGSHHSGKPTPLRLGIGMLSALVAFSESSVEGFAPPEAAHIGQVLVQPGDESISVLDVTESAGEKNHRSALGYYMTGLLAVRNGQDQTAEAAFRRASDWEPGAGAPFHELALLQLRNGNLGGSEMSARRAMELDPSDYKLRLRFALVNAARGQADSARTLVEEALQAPGLDTQSADYLSIHQVRAQLLAQVNAPDLAADSYEVLLDALENPENYGLSFRQHQRLMNGKATSYETVGRVLLTAGRAASAATAFLAVQRIQGDEVGENTLLLARSLYLEDKLEESEQQLEKWLAAEQPNEMGLQLLRDLYRNTDREDQLPARLEKLREEYPGQDEVALFLADVYVDRGDTDPARDVLQTLLADSGNPECYIGLLKIEVISADADQFFRVLSRAARARVQLPEILPLIDQLQARPNFAGQVLERGLAEAESDPDQAATLWAFCSELAARAGNLEAQEILLERAIGQTTGPAMMLVLLKGLGRNLLQQEKLEKAAAVYGRLMEIPGLPPGERLDALFRLSQTLSFLDRHDDALKAIKSALRIMPGVGLLNYQLGWVQLRAGQLDEAEATLKETLEKFSADANVSGQAGMLLGDMYSMQRKWSLAAEQYERLLEAAGEDLRLRRILKMALSNAYVQSGFSERGEKLLEEIYEATPDDPGINNDLGYLYADAGKNLEKAEAMIRLAVEAQPDNAAYLDSLGWVLFRQGRFEEALDPLEKANANPEDEDATLLEHLGDVYEALSRTDEARKAWTRALEVEEQADHPEDEILERLRSKLSQD